jgi:hypothetical protein
VDRITFERQQIEDVFLFAVKVFQFTRDPSLKFRAIAMMVTCEISIGRQESVRGSMRRAIDHFESRNNRPAIRKMGPLRQ